MRPTPDEIRSIYAGIESRPGLGVDLSGWNSETPIFDEVIGLTNPAVIVEVGVWNGASLIHMAKCCQRRGLDTLFYAIDVFYGRSGDSIGHLPESQIPLRWDTPSRYEQFLYNVKSCGFDDRVIPVCNFTYWGARMLSKWQVQADAIYIDAGHDDLFAYDDFQSYWPNLRSGGIMFGDDLGYPGVVAALGRFGKEHNLSLNIVGGQWYYRKP